MATQNTQDALTKVSEISYLDNTGLNRTIQTFEDKSGGKVVKTLIDGVEQPQEAVDQAAK